MEGPRADFHVIRLQDNAALGGPEMLERQQKILKGPLWAQTVFFRERAGRRFGRRGAGSGLARVLPLRR
jgi:hypothetical protein